MRKIKAFSGYCDSFGLQIQIYLRYRLLLPETTFKSSCDEKFQTQLSIFYTDTVPPTPRWYKLVVSALCKAKTSEFRIEG